MAPSDALTWLQERTALGILSSQVLGAIAQSMRDRAVSANTRLVERGTPPDGVYVLREGQLERDLPSGGSRGDRAKTVLGAGSIVHLEEFLLDQPARRTLTTLTDCQFWFIPRDRFRELIAQYGEISQVFSQQLARQLDRVAARLSYEQERQIALRPYIVPKARRGVVGNSRYAVRLRQQIKRASGDRGSVLIFGEPGLEKDNLAALIHFGSDRRREPMIQVNSRLLQASGSELFGRAGGKPGLIEWVGEGTLVLNNIQELPEELFPLVVQLFETGSYTPVTREGEPPASPRPCSAKVIAISETAQSNVERLVEHFIKVPPLRVRKADIKAKVDYYISLICRSRGIPRPRLTPEALRRLQSYDFPQNLRELQSLVERAIVQASGASELTEEIFWSTGPKKKQFRFNLLNAYPKLRRFLRSPWWPDRINYGFTLAFFAFVVLVLFIGPQNRQENFALNLFWAWWWPLVLLGFPLVGRVWCAVCPFMIYGEVTQKLSTWLFPGKLKSWPREEAEKWGGWFLFGLFALILLWEELWNLENTAYLSSCLLLLITAGAMIFSALFERRFWCRYLCPIGGMNGLYAKLSAIELRAQQGICSAECTTYQCYKGGPQKGEGLETGGCPVYSHPAQLEDNRDCVLCMTCLKACPHRSVELNLRPPGIELWTTHVPRSYEVALLLLLLDSIFLRRLPEIEAELGLNLHLDQFWSHFGISVAALVLPALIPIAAYGIIRLVQSSPKPRPFWELAYGYLPLVLGGNLAHYLRLGLTEAGRIVPVTFATFGWSGEDLPVVVAHPAVIAFLQGSVLIFSTAIALWLSQRISRQPFWRLIPQHLAAIAIAVACWSIILQ